MRRPSTGCRSFGTAERIRVPSPAAMTTAAIGVSVTRGVSMAGAPGFEPGIAGPKPAALPLGYAPENASILADLHPARFEPTQARRMSMALARRHALPYHRAIARGCGWREAQRGKANQGPGHGPVGK